MAVPTMDFDWLLDHASAIAFDPGRPSIYVFGLDMTPEELQAGAEPNGAARSLCRRSGEVY